MMRFIDPAISIPQVADMLAGVTRFEELSEEKIPVLEGAINLERFLTPEGRQLLEGQVYSSGSDLRHVYRTSRTGLGENELIITEADEQVPVVGELRRELDAFLEEVFPLTLKHHAVQLRELAPKSFGHPRHVDYEKGVDVVERDGTCVALTSISLSLPISWNEGVAPVFIMEVGSKDVRQSIPGSLALFGPRIYHSHPPTDDIERPYLWLVTQAFFEKPLKAPSKPDFRRPKGRGIVTAPTIASWVGSFVDDADAIRELEVSEERIRLAYRELLSGYDTDPSNVLKVVAEVESYEGLVIGTEIGFTSLCAHHFLPYFGTVDVAYDPGNSIAGLGKLVRLVQAYARRFQLQEFLVRDIAEELMRSLGARGAFVRSRARHLGMHSRGPGDRRVETVCTYATGSLRGKPAAEVFS